MEFNKVSSNNKIIITFWEESKGDDDISPDGCSIHLSESGRKKYIKSIYSDRTDDVPDSYDRPIGDFGYTAYVTDAIYNKLKEELDIRLSQVELKNLMVMEELIVEYLF